MKKIAFLQIGVGTILLSLIDIFSKHWAVVRLARGPWELFPYVRLVYSENQGIAFGIDIAGVNIAVLSVILLIAFAVYSARALDLSRLSVKIALILVFGGALGNLYDRIALSIVRDFISIGPWPLFNIADVAIVIGLGLLLIHLYLPSHDSK